MGGLSEFSETMYYLVQPNLFINISGTKCAILTRDQAAGLISYLWPIGLRRPGPILLWQTCWIPSRKLLSSEASTSVRRVGRAP